MKITGKYNRIIVALPVMNEMEYLPSFLEALRVQTISDFDLYVCVNQPDKWWGMKEKIRICDDNRIALDYLIKITDINVKVIDRSSPGKGWDDKNHGVGWARKVIMDEISRDAGENDLIISLDADTDFRQNYFESLVHTFNCFHHAAGMAVPYYHHLGFDEEANRAILRYEIYMRNYNLNLWRIGSPYAFTALGSAMATPVWAYRAVGGLTPKKSGEDFYFLQKLRKFGELICWNEGKVYPAARFSDRVFFGTGPAMIRGRAGDWESYPVYNFRLFDIIKQTYRDFRALYYNNLDTPVDAFLKSRLNDENIWDPLRKNSKTLGQFIRACHDRLDGLRILQFLKQMQKELQLTDEENLFLFLKEFYPDKLKELDPGMRDFSFINSDIGIVNEIRNMLAIEEEKYQKESMLLKNEY